MPVSEPQTSARHVPPNAAHPDVPPPEDEAPQPPSLSEIAQVMLSLLRELPKLVNDRFELLSLDLRRSGGALGKIIGLIVALAILGVTVWLLVWAGVLLALVMAGLPRWGALLVAIGVNLLGLWWAAAQIRKQVPKLLLASFRRHLTLTPLPPPEPLLDPADDPAPPEPGPAAPTGA